MLACRVVVAAPPKGVLLLAGTALQVALTAGGTGMILAFRKALARLAVRVRQRRLAGIGLALVVGTAPEIAVFALEAAQAAVFAVGTGEGFFRAGERLN